MPDARPADTRRGTARGCAGGGNACVIHPPGGKTARWYVACTAGGSGDTGRLAAALGSNTAAAVHPQGTRRRHGPRALSDGVCRPAWCRGGADGRTALHRRGLCPTRRARHRPGIRDTARWGRDVSAGADRPCRTAPFRPRVVRAAGGDGRRGTQQPGKRRPNRRRRQHVGARAGNRGGFRCAYGPGPARRR